MWKQDREQGEQKAFQEKNALKLISQTNSSQNDWQLLFFFVVAIMRGGPCSSENLQQCCLRQQCCGGICTAHRKLTYRWASCVVCRIAGTIMPTTGAEKINSPNSSIMLILILLRDVLCFTFSAFCKITPRLRVRRRWWTKATFVQGQWDTYF